MPETAMIWKTKKEVSKVKGKKGVDVNNQAKGSRHGTKRRRNH